MSSRLWPSVVAVSLPPLLVSVWLAVPALRPQPVQISGELENEEVCLLICARVLSVAGKRLSCKADFIGTPHDCHRSVLQPGTATVSFVSLPSVADIFGIAPTVGVVTRVERDSKVLFQSTPSRQVWHALYGGWLLHTIYWPIAGFVVWRWPNSRFSRRVNWQQDPEA